MAETDILNNLATSNPNEPATKGLVLLLRAETQSEFRALRAEMKSEFQAVRSEIKQMGQRMDQVEQKMDTGFAEVNLSLDFIAQKIGQLVSQQQGARQN